MPGIEVIVRPSVFPDIRPTAKETGVSADPNAGRTVLTGMDGQVVDLNLSLSQSASKQHGHEEARMFDIARIFRVVPEGETPAATLGPSTRDAPDR
jgi:hypothetical protein